MAAPTCQDVVDLARFRLQDAKTRQDGSTRTPRHSDEQLMVLLLGALRESYLSRPDVWLPLRSGSVAAFLNPPFDTYVLATGWMLAQTWIPIFADYVAAQAEYPNDERAAMQRAQLFYSNFKLNLTK